MTWATPPTFASGNVLTAAQLNVLTGDLLETLPGNALHGIGGRADLAGGSGGTTFSPGVYAATAANAVAEMRVGQQTLAITETTNSSTFTDLATIGPQVTVTCNAFAVVFVNVAVQLDTANTAATGWQVDGATTIAVANNGPSINNATNDQVTMMNCRSVAVNAGDNTFTLKYVVSAGSVGTFWRRHMTVWPF